MSLDTALWYWTAGVLTRYVSAVMHKGVSSSVNQSVNKPANHTSTSAYKLQAIDRAVVLMDLLARSDAPLNLTDISTRLKLHKSTTQRFLRVLQAHHLVSCRTDGRYHLGLRLHDLGGRALEQFDIRDRALPYFRALVEDVKETGHLCVMRRNAIVYLDKISSARSVCQTSRVGLSNPIHCTSVGKAMLAFCSSEERDAILAALTFERRTAKTHLTYVSLLKDLHMTRRRGYAVDDEEIEDGVRCVGAPILNSEGRPIAAISLSGPSFRMTRTKLPSIARKIIACCAEISRSLGYEDSPTGAAVKPSVTAAERVHAVKRRKLVHL